MIKWSIRRFFVYFSVFLLSVFLLLLFTLPKFLLLDKLFMQRGLYLTAEAVEEGIFSIRLKRAVIYTKSSKLLSFDRFEVYLKPFSLQLGGICERGYLWIERSFWGLYIRAKDFNCLSGFEGLSGELSLKDGVRGRLSLKTLRVQEVSLEEVSFDFKGRLFSVKAKLQGLELSGDGQVVFNPADPLKSKVNGYVGGGGFRFLVSGTLDRLELRR